MPAQCLLLSEAEAEASPANNTVSEEDGCHSGRSERQASPEWPLQRGLTDSSGRSEGASWETGKVNFRIQERNTHRTSPRGPCPEVVGPILAKTEAVLGESM